MANTMSYKGYQARIAYDDADEILVGHIAGIADVIGFHADNVAELRKAFEEGVDDYIETCRRIGKAPQKAFSGKLMLRISPELHAEVARAAQLSGVSINQLAEAALKTVGGMPARERSSQPASTQTKVRRRKPVTASVRTA